MRTRICMLALALFALSCGDDTFDPGPSTGTPLDNAVWTNMLEVQEAAETFAAANGGEYPQGDWDQALDGRTLIDFLPNGVRLKNPVTALATDPVLVEPDGLGSTAYRGVITPDLLNVEEWVGYVITGRGESGDMVVTNAPDSLVQRHQQTIDNCFVAQQAANAFAADNSGVYATDGRTQNPMRKTLTDYLPGGRLLINPYTTARTEPNWGGAASGAGSCGYLASDVDGDGVIDGYVIDATGADGATIIKTICHLPVNPQICGN